MSQPMTTVLRGHLTSSDREQQHFQLVPFEVPSGVGQLVVELSFSQLLPADQAGWQDGNILDLGLFDSRGAGFLEAAGFRGWSASKAGRFVIGSGQATPGYTAGLIPAGTWHAVLGLYQIALDGCDYEISIEMRQGEPQVGARPVTHAQETVSATPGWYRGDFHAHTWHSDGTASLWDLASAARAQHLDFVTVTEHNTVSHLREVQAGHGDDLLLVPGVEISTYRGHANVWPVDGFVEFRCQTDEEMRAVRDAIRARGALFSVNHPKEDGPPWQFGSLFEPDCIEVWGGPWFLSNYQSLANWDAQLRKGCRVTAVGGSDKHVGPYSGEASWYDVGTPCTWVYADGLSVQTLADGVRRGRVWISATPRGPLLEFSASVPALSGSSAGIGDRLRIARHDVLRLVCGVCGATGSLLRLVSPARTLVFEIARDDFEVSVEVPAVEPSYWRAEVIEPPEAPIDQEPAALMVLALTNPIYVEV